MFTLTIYFIALNVYVEFVLIYRPHPVCLNSGPKHWQSPFWALPMPRPLFLILTKLWSRTLISSSPLRTSPVTKLGDHDKIRWFYNSLCKMCKISSLVLIRVVFAGSVPDFVTGSGSAFCVSWSGSGFKNRIQICRPLFCAFNFVTFRFWMSLKVPKCEIFNPFFFTPINPIWVGDLRTG